MSDPRSASYGQYLSLSELGQVLGTAASHTAVVNHLRSKGLTDVSSTANQEFVTVRLTAAEAEDLLATRFYEFHHRKSYVPSLLLLKSRMLTVNGWIVDGGRLKRIHRAPEYSLPEELVAHVDFVGHTVSFPEVTPGTFLHSRKPTKGESVTPQTLFNYYNISNPVVSNTAATQSVYENLQQSYGTPRRASE